MELPRTVTSSRGSHSGLTGAPSTAISLSPGNSISPRRPCAWPQFTRYQGEKVTKPAQVGTSQEATGDGLGLAIRVWTCMSWFLDNTRS